MGRGSTRGARVALRGPAWPRGILVFALCSVACDASNSSAPADGGAHRRSSCKDYQTPDGLYCCCDRTLCTVEPCSTSMLDAGHPRHVDPCGDGRIEPPEACDGANLGGQSCDSATMGLMTDGILRCTHTCVIDTSGCRRVPRGTGGLTGAGGARGVSDAGIGGIGGQGGVGGNAGASGVGGNAGASYGDPHLFTADGTEYDFQAVGEFVFLEDRDDPAFVVQVRQTPHRRFTTLSSNTAVAALVASDRVSIEAGNPAIVRVEGLPTAVSRSVPLRHGGRIVHSEGVFTVVWPTGEALVVGARSPSLLDVTFRRGPRARRLHGLIGTPDGDPTNDFTARDGAPTAGAPGGAALYDRFGESYRITDAESLFDHAPGECTATFTDRDFPRGGREQPIVPPAELKQAYLACVLEGVTDETALESCARDVALTGDLGFALAAATSPAACRAPLDR